MRNIFKTTKPELKSRITKAVIGAQAAYAAFSMGFMEAYAGYAISSTAASDPTDAFFNLAFKVLQIVGGGLFLFGAVGIVTARSDGDSSQIMNQIGKLAGGAILVGLPEFLKGANIITF